MAQLIVRNLEDDVKSRLQEMARHHGRSTEEEVREILRTAVLTKRAPEPPLGTRLLRRFQAIGLEEPLQELRRRQARPADLE